MKSRILLITAIACAVFFLSFLLGRYPAPYITSVSEIVNNSMAWKIVMDIRMPRIIMALLLGMVLSASGMTFQMIFRNPLVDSGFLGVSGGAASGACLAIVLLGGLWGITWTDTVHIVIISLPCLCIIWLMRWRLNLLAMRDETTFSLVAAPGRERSVLLLAAVIASAAVVSKAGQIGWVGLIVPHIARRIVGSDAQKALPCSLVLGGLFVLVCDDISRILLSGEIPLGILTIAKDAIKTVGLQSFSHRAVPSLSSGEKQLATVARSLAQTPSILLFDESTSHLDLSNSRRILALMKNSARDGKTVLFTTHDPNAAIAIADHIVLIRKEKLIASGGIKEVMTETNISDTYGEPVEVIQTDQGLVVLSLRQ
jgi:ABC-type Fe3+-siderophore transport system permease subunit